jgi:hypothetical protein
MRQARQRGDLMAQLDADLMWIDGAEARLDRLAAHIRATPEEATS